MLKIQVDNSFCLNFARKEIISVRNIGVLSSGFVHCRDMTTSRSLAVITGVPQACLALDMLVASDKIDADLEVTASCFLK